MLITYNLHEIVLTSKTEYATIESVARSRRLQLEKKNYGDILSLWPTCGQNKNEIVGPTFRPLNAKQRKFHQWTP
jgi:hypothetical protein